MDFKKGSSKNTLRQETLKPTSKINFTINLERDFEDNYINKTLTHSNNYYIII